MDDVMIFAYYWVIPVAIFYALFGSIARSYREKTKRAISALTTAPAMQADFQQVAYLSLWKARKQFWLVAIPLFIVSSIGFNIYTLGIEPSADFFGDGLGVFGMGFFIPPIAVCTVLASTTYSRWRQTTDLLKFTNHKLGKKSTPQALESAQEIMTQGSKGQAGVAIFSAAAMIACTAVGIAWLVLFYLATEQAISCARSSKGC